VAQLLNSNLSHNSKVDLVEREQLDKILNEHDLGQTGVIDPDSAAQIGKLLGAKILIAPSTFVSGKEVFLTAKVISVETGRVKVASRYMSLTGIKASAICSLVGDDIGKILDGDIAKSKSLSDEDKLKGVIENIKKATADSKRPTVTVVVPEEHLRRVVPDPAVNSQICYIFRKLKFQVIENESPELEKWVKDYFAGKSGKFPSDGSNVDVLIYGGAFTEGAGMTGNLHSARARVELNAIDLKTSEIIAVNRGTGSAADVSEAIAFKSALEKATMKVAQEFITDMIKDWPGNAPGVKEKDKPKDAKEKDKDNEKDKSVKENATDKK
jgi:hypothetical protein